MFKTTKATSMPYMLKAAILLCIGALVGNSMKSERDDIDKLEDSGFTPDIEQTAAGLNDPNITIYNIRVQTVRFFGGENILNYFIKHKKGDLPYVASKYQTDELLSKLPEGITCQVTIDEHENALADSIDANSTSFTIKHPAKTNLPATKAEAVELSREATSAGVQR